MVCPFKLTWMTDKGYLQFENSSRYILKTDFIETCPGCTRTMAAVPQAAFAAKKVRKNEEKRKEFCGATELNPMNYSSKYMNSIWGQYNRYSVHNLKKIMDDSFFAMSVGKDKKSSAATQSVEKPAISTDLGSVGSTISFSPHNIYN